MKQKSPKKKETKTLQDVIQTIIYSKAFSYLELCRLCSVHISIKTALMGARMEINQSQHWKLEDGTITTGKNVVCSMGPMTWSSYYVVNLLPSFAIWGITSLTLGDCDNTSLQTLLQHLPNLECLVMGNSFKRDKTNNHLQSIEGLENVPRLKELSIDGFPNLSTLSGLKSCRTIENLSISNCDKLATVDDLEACTSLDGLSIENCLITTLTIPDQLLKLYIDCPKLALSEISITNHLKTLNICNVSSMDKLENFTSLVDLLICGICLDIAAITSLRHLTLLTNLELSASNIYASPILLTTTLASLHHLNVFIYDDIDWRDDMNETINISTMSRSETTLSFKTNIHLHTIFIMQVPFITSLELPTSIKNISMRMCDALDLVHIPTAANMKQIFVKDCKKLEGFKIGKCRISLGYRM